jgi:hypothetical protein
MDSAVAVVDAKSDIEALYRANVDRLCRAILAFAGGAEIASEMRRSRLTLLCDQTHVLTLAHVDLAAFSWEPAIPTEGALRG